MPTNFNSNPPLLAPARASSSHPQPQGAILEPVTEYGSTSHGEAPQSKKQNYHTSFTYRQGWRWQLLISSEGGVSYFIWDLLSPTQCLSLHSRSKKLSLDASVTIQLSMKFIDLTRDAESRQGVGPAAW